MTLLSKNEFYSGHRLDRSCLLLICFISYFLRLKS